MAAIFVYSFAKLLYFLS